MHFAQVVKTDHMGNPSHGKVGYIILLKTSEMPTSERTVRRWSE